MRRPIKHKRVIAPDYKYQSQKVAKLINYVMRDGEKNIARTIVYSAFDEITKTGDDPLVIFDTALQNVSPLVELRSRRVGGANYQVPKEVSAERRQTLAFRWIVQFARKRKGLPMYRKLADELIHASKGEGESVNRRETTHKMAEANKMFAHLGW